MICFYTSQKAIDHRTVFFLSAYKHKMRIGQFGYITAYKHRKDKNGKGLHVTSFRGSSD